MTVKEYNQLVDQYADGVYRFILKNIRDEEKAKDLAQDAFEKIWKKHEEIKAEKAKSYLFTTAYRCVIDLVRKEKKKANWEEVDERDYLDHGNQYNGLNEILQAALQQLPVAQRSVVMLRDYEGYDYKEISEITNLTVTQVKVYIFRARKSLREKLVDIEVII